MVNSDRNSDYLRARESCWSGVLVGERVGFSVRLGGCFFCVGIEVGRLGDVVVGECRFSKVSRRVGAVR